MNSDHQCEHEDVVMGLEVMLHLDLIRPLCPQHDERTLRVLLQRHAKPIAAHMIGAGIQAAVHIFTSEGGVS
jgi:hypothetical protein